MPNEEMLMQTIAQRTGRSVNIHTYRIAYLGFEHFLSQPSQRMCKTSQTPASEQEDEQNKEGGPRDLSTLPSALPSDSSEHDR